MARTAEQMSRDVDRLQSDMEHEMEEDVEWLEATEPRVGLHVLLEATLLALCCVGVVRARWRRTRGDDERAADEAFSGGLGMDDGEAAGDEEAAGGTRSAHGASEVAEVHERAQMRRQISAQLERLRAGDAMRDARYKRVSADDDLD